MINEREPPEPSCPPDRRPHRERIAEIVRACPLNKTAGVVIDDTPEHRAYYLYQLDKYEEIRIVYEGVLSHDTGGGGSYLIKITKSALN